jgi:hypothetical protein
MSKRENNPVRQEITALFQTELSGTNYTKYSLVELRDLVTTRLTKVNKPGPLFAKTKRVLKSVSKKESTKDILDELTSLLLD